MRRFDRLQFGCSVNTDPSDSVLGPTKHRTQNVSLVRRLLRTRFSVIYIGNQAYVFGEKSLTERKEMPRTDFKSSFEGITHAPGSWNDVPRNESTKMTNENRNAACMDG